ncbi:tetratricopeptide repeat protein [bacterium]|nr:tetratricopeptide repeat protein [bacterium]
MKKIIQRIRILIKKIQKADLVVKDYQKTSLSAIMPSYAYINWGKYLARQGDMQGAISKFETSTAMAQQIPEAYINLGLVYATLKDYKRAGKNFRKAIRLDRNSAKAHSLLASILMEENNVEEAQNLYQKASQLDPRDSEIYVNWAISLLKLKKTNEAFEKFKLAVLYNPTNFIATQMWGIALYENFRYDEAIKQFEYTNSFNPNDYLTYYYLGCCYLKKKDYKQALIPAKKSLLLNTCNIDTYLLIGEIYLKLNNKEKCLSVFNDLFKQGLSSPRAIISHGMALKHFKNFQQAKEKFLEILLSEPNNLIALYNLAICELCLNNEDAGYNILLNVVNKNPKHTEALYNIGIYHFKHGQFDDAINYLQNVLEISPMALPNVYFDIANCYTGKQDLQQAIKYFNKNIEYYPNHIESYVNLSTIYLETGDFVEAQRKIRTAYKQDKENVFLNYTYAIIHFESKLYKEALDKFEFVLSKDITQTGAFLGKLECLININQPQKVIEIIENLEDKNRPEIQQLYSKAYTKLACIEPSYYNIEKAREIIAQVKSQYPETQDMEMNLEKLEELKTKIGE